MAYDFSTLSPTDFERIARDLLGRELNCRFEGFSEGPDDGMDGRYISADNKITLQAKHYIRSGFSALKSTMKKERSSIDALATTRYILVTSASLTPANKTALSEIIGPSLQTLGDIFGPEDLNGLLRKYPDLEVAHRGLWEQSAAVLKAIVTEAVEEANNKCKPMPPVLANLLASDVENATNVESQSVRNVVFIIKASPVDDEFTLWLAPKLEAEGYRIFADILTLQPGDRWRREINRALENRAAKVLLLCRPSTLDNPDVQDDIDIALDVGKELGDPRFIIPVRLESGRKVKGIGDAITVDFVRGWGEGLTSLIKTLGRQEVPKQSGLMEINPNWELFRRRGAIPLVDEPEHLTSNWLRVVEAPDEIFYYEPAGVVQQVRLKKALHSPPFPVAIYGRGFLAFAEVADVEAEIQSVGRLKQMHRIPLKNYAEGGFEKLGIRRQTASNQLNAMMKDAWIRYCRDRGFIRYLYSESIGFHASAEQAPIGKLFSWGRQGKRRASMLRNVAKGHIWQFGVTALPALWPFWHVKLKSRVLFASDNGTPTGLQIDDPGKMHRLRRSVCKGWRNKQWHGRMLAFLELLSGESAYIRLPLAPGKDLVLDAEPILFSSPVSTALPDTLGADDEETDQTTLGKPDIDQETIE